MVLPGLLLLRLEEPLGAEQLEAAPKLVKLLMDLAPRKAGAQMTTAAGLFHSFTSA